MELHPAPVPTALLPLGSGPMYLLNTYRLRSYAFIKPVFINYKGQTFPVAEIWMPGVSSVLAGGEGRRLSHRVSSRRWSPAAHGGMLSSE